MRRLALAALLAALASPALAQPAVKLRGGEHADFTRLVLTLPRGADWTLAPVEGGFALRLSAPLPFDLSEAFARIPRTRVAALTDEGGGLLALAVPCDCHAAAFLYREGGLVIDLRDGAGPPGAPRPGLPAGQLPEAPTLPLVADRAQAPPLPVAAPPAAPPVAAPPVAAPPAAPADAPALPAEDGRAQAIAEGIARAASFGLLDPAPGARLPDPRPDPDPAPTPAPEPDPAPVAALPALPGLALRDAARPPDPAAAPALGPAGEPCLPPEAFDLAAWAGGDDLPAALAPRLAALTDARDRVDPEAAEALARTYVAFGLGREALAALAADGGASAARDRLRLLARIVDGDPVDPAAFEGQAGCLGPVALWRALARGSVAGTGPQERTALLVALRALPAPLRGPLALRLADLHLAAGEPEEAAALLPLAGGAGRGTDLAKALAAVHGPRPQDGLARLEALARSDARLPPEAMALLLRLSSEARGAVADDLLALSAAIRAEHAGSPAARDLLLAEIRALSATGRHGEALSRLDEGRRADSAPGLDAAAGEVVQAMVRDAPDAAFLALALEGLPARLPEAAADAAARRLLAMGFPPEALALVGPEGGGTARRLLRAEALAALGDRAGAEAALAGLPGPRAEALRAALRAPPPEPPAPPPPAAEPPALPPLAARRALLDEAAAARARATALLAQGDG
jgi:hypothetical protein